VGLVGDLAAGENRVACGAEPRGAGRGAQFDAVGREVQIEPGGGLFEQVVREVPRDYTFVSVTKEVCAVRIVLFLLSAFFFTSSLYAVQMPGALPLAGGMLVAAAVLFAGAAVVEAINLRAREILKRLPPSP
jgi:hypothetical protein